MSSSERRMSLKEISRSHFTTSLRSGGGTPSPSPAKASPSKASSSRSNSGSVRRTNVRRASMSILASERLRSSSTVGGPASAPRRMSTSTSTPSTPVVPYNSRMVDKLQVRCDELELELQEIRKESAKREEELRLMLRESKVDVKALGTKLKQKDAQVSELKKKAEEGNAKLLEVEMRGDIEDENVKQLREELEKSREESAQLKKELERAQSQGKSLVFEEKKEKERVLIESREKELDHLKELDKVKQDVNQGMRRELELQDEVDVKTRELRESQSLVDKLEVELREERMHSSLLEQDLEVAESNLVSINDALRRVSQEQKGGKDLVQQSKELQEAKLAVALAQKKYNSSDAELAKERFFHAEDLSEMVVERACHREMAKQNQQRILGVLRAMRTGIVVAQDKLEEYVQAKPAS